MEHFQQEAINLDRNGRTEESGFRLPRVACQGKVNICEETNGVKFACRFLWCLLWVDKSLSPEKENLYIAFTKKGAALSGFDASELPSAQIIFKSKKHILR